jgi:hypothetical protein
LKGVLCAPPFSPALHYGGSRIVEARIDQTLGDVLKLNARDLAWLRENNAQILAEKAERLGEELSALAIAVRNEGAAA